MGDGLKFQQRWAFRKRDNDLESSSEDSESHSTSGPVFKKHKLVASFVSCEDDETNDSPSLQLGAETNPDTPDENKLGKSKKVQRGRSKKDKLPFSRMEKGSRNGFPKGSTKTECHEPGHRLNDLKMFMGSLLDDLKGARENLFAWMKDEMHKLVADGNVLRTRRREGCYGGENIQVGNAGVHPPNNNQGNLEAEQQKHSESRVKVKRSVKSKKAAMAQALEDQAGNGRSTEHTKSTKTDKGAELESSVTTNFKLNPSDQIDQQQLHSNFCLISQAQNCNGRGDLDQVARFIAPTGKVREERSGLSSNPSDQNTLLQHHNKFVPGIRFGAPTDKDIGKRFRVSVKPNISSNPSGELESSMYLSLPTVLTAPCFENDKLDIPSCNHMQSRLTGSRMDVNSERVNPMVDASSCRQFFPGLQQEERFRKFAPRSSRSITQNSMTGNGFQSMDCGFSIPSQVSLDHHSRYILGLRMNGGIIRFSGENHTLPGQYFPNNFNNHLNYKLDSGLLSFQTPGFKDGRLPPK